MLLYVPVSKADYHLAAHLFRWIAKLGGIGDHPMVLAFAPVGIPDVEAEIIRREAATLGRGVYPIPMSNHPELGWPRSANFIFQEAATYALHNKAHGQNCWYFFELDNVPLKEGWLDTLQAEYDYRDRPCMGTVNKTFRGAQGGRESGKHLVGTAIYPPDYFTQARICRHLHLLNDPFDVALQEQTVPIAWNTKLIQHNWSTCKYTYDPAKEHFTCEPSTARATSRDYATPVSVGGRGPCVVHGCKDNSLVRGLEKLHRNKAKKEPKDNDNER
jgi:hypothetical protein